MSTRPRPPAAGAAAAATAASLDRRALLVGGAGLALAACAEDALPPLPLAAPPGAADGGAGADAGPLDGGVPVRVLAFEDEGSPTFGAKTGVGLDARKLFDLAVLARVARDAPGATPPAGGSSAGVGGGLDAGRLVLPPEDLYLRTERPDTLAPGAPFAVRLGGLVAAPVSVTTAELLALARPVGAHLLECSGNTKHGAFGLMGATTWDGVPVADLLARVAPTDATARVLVRGADDHTKGSPSGRSTPGASWIFARDELVAAGAFLATGMGGAPLVGDHGAPARLVVPGFYGCACIKWVDAIDLVPDDAPATSQMLEFWDRTHQHAPWELARQYHAPRLDAAALPIRAEIWNVNGRERLRVVGIAWGGDAPATLLRIFFGEGSGDPVGVALPAAGATTWGLWEWVGAVPRSGSVRVRLAIEPPQARQYRQGLGWYDRTIRV